MQWCRLSGQTGYEHHGQDGKTKAVAFTSIMYIERHTSGCALPCLRLARPPDARTVQPATTHRAGRLSSSAAARLVELFRVDLSVLGKKVK